MRKKLWQLMLLTAVISMSTSCLLFTVLDHVEKSTPTINGKKVDLKTQGSPKTHCLAFYYLDVAPKATFIQTNPQKTAMYTQPFEIGLKCYSFPPLETDLTFQMVKMSYTRNFGNTISTYSFQPALGSGNNIIFTTKHTGLYFIGAYTFQTEGSAGAIQPLSDEKQAKYELQALENLKPKFKNTEWEIEIEKRIQELKK